jgi:putative membrane protein
MTTFDRILASLGTGLPVLLLAFVITIILLAVGVACYMSITPFQERRLVAEGNVAAGIILGGMIVALAIPLAATLATSSAALDVLLWGIVAVLLQLVVFGLVAAFVRGLRPMIEEGNVAVALTLVGVQLAVALLNAGVMAG